MSCRAPRCWDRLKHRAVVLPEGGKGPIRIRILQGPLLCALLYNPQRPQLDLDGLKVLAHYIDGPEVCADLLRNLRLKLALKISLACFVEHEGPEDRNNFVPCQITGGQVVRSVGLVADSEFFQSLGEVPGGLRRLDPGKFEARSKLIDLGAEPLDLLKSLANRPRTQPSPGWSFIA